MLGNMNGNSEKVSNPTTVPCAICLDTISEKNNAVTSCGHNFHLSCICRHIFLSASGRKCPICRALLPDVRNDRGVQAPTYPPLPGFGTTMHFPVSAGVAVGVRRAGPRAALLQMQRRRPLLNTIIERRMRAGQQRPPSRRGNEEMEKTRRMRRLKRMLESNVSY